MCINDKLIGPSYRAKMNNYHIITIVIKKGPAIRSELVVVVQLFRASALGLCRAECHRGSSRMSPFYL